MNGVSSGQLSTQKKVLLLAEDYHAAINSCSSQEDGSRASYPFHKESSSQQNVIINEGTKFKNGGDFN